jgi:sulfonate transport system substrate-binding protein
MKNTKKWIIMLLITMLTSSLLAGCAQKPAESGTGNGAANNAGGQLKTVRIGGFTAELSENASVAKHLGYIDEELAKVGYQPEYFGFVLAGPAMNEALGTDNLDVGVYADFPHLVARSKGLDIRAFATANSQYQYALVVHQDSGINSVQDLEGKKIVFAIGTILQKVFEQICTTEGVDSSKIQNINAVADEQALFAAKETDAVLCILQAAKLMEINSGGKSLYSSIDHPELSATLNVVGRGAFLDENPEAAKAIVRALYRAYDYVIANPDQAYDALATDTVPADRQREIYSYANAFASFKPEFDAAAIARIDNTNQFLVAQGIIPEEIDVPGQYLDLRFIDAVKAELNK